jgi:hypothetical protein
VATAEETWRDRKNCRVNALIRRKLHLETLGMTSRVRIKPRPVIRAQPFDLTSVSRRFWSWPWPWLYGIAQPGNLVPSSQGERMWRGPGLFCFLGLLGLIISSDVSGVSEGGCLPRNSDNMIIAQYSCPPGTCQCTNGGCAKQCCR